MMLNAGDRIPATDKCNNNNNNNSWEIFDSKARLRWGRTLGAASHQRRGNHNNR
jgi:hypothetical protein